MSYYDVKKKQFQSTGTTVQETIVKDSKLRIVNGFKNTPAYKLGKLVHDDLTEINLDTRVVNIDNSVKEKKIYLLPDTVVKVGEYIKYLDRTYLVQEFEDNLISPMCKVLLCNAYLNWKGLESLVPCYITNSSYGSKGEVHNIEQISDFDARAVIYVGNNILTKAIRNGMRFIFKNSKDDVYEVTKKTTAYDDYVSLTCKYVKWVQEDDFVNNIAFNSFLEDNVDPSIDITLIGEEFVLINTTQTYTISNATNVTFKLDDDTIAENNAEIVSQDGTSCVVKMLKDIMCQIECRDSLDKILHLKTIYGVTKL